MVQNLETLVAANPLLKALWSNQYIANIQITASETVGVEERAGYYETAGAIRDMFQNHMLQLLMMTAMHLPARITEKKCSPAEDSFIEIVAPPIQKGCGKPRRPGSVWRWRHSRPSRSCLS